MRILSPELRKRSHKPTSSMRETVLRLSFYELKERPGRVAQGSPGGIDQPNLPLDLELRYLDLDQRSFFEVLLDTHFWQKGHTLVPLHHQANRLDGWHLHVHVQTDFVPLKLAKDRIAVV